MEQVAHAPPRAPTHLWIVGGLSLLWNAFGAYDYLMTQTANEAYLASFTDLQRAYFESFPPAMEAFWAFGVWGALAGSILLVMRKALASLLFGVSIAGLLGSTFYQFAVLNPPADLMTPAMMTMTVVIWAVALALFYYARAMRREGWLR